jgi:hypothetical protein
MKDEQVNIVEMLQHPDYIRVNVSKANVEQYAQIIKDSGWVFPPVELQPIPSTEKSYTEGKRYWIIDGTHRISAAIEAKFEKKIPAKVHLPLTAIDAIALQLKTNMSHGIRLSTSVQTNAIKKMKEMGATGKMIAQKAGISEPSVSRILGGTQRATESGEPGNVDKGGKPGGNANPPKPFKTVDWLKSLNRVLKGYAKHGTKIRKAGFPAECQAAVDTLVANLLTKKEDETK